MLTACNNPNGWDCIQSKGSIITEVRQPGNFTKIFLYDKVDVELIQHSGEDFIEIKAGKNLIPEIKTDLEGERLTIRNLNTCELLRNSDVRPLLRIYFDSLSNLDIRSSGYVITSDSIFSNQILISKRSNGDLKMIINTDNVFIYSNELGDAFFSGKTRAVSVRQEGVGLVDFSAINAIKANIFTQGPGTTRINVEEELKAEIQGNGKLEVFGIPNIQNISKSEKGEVVYYP